MAGKHKRIRRQFWKTQALAVLKQLVTRQGYMNAINDGIILLTVLIAVALPLIFLLTPGKVEEARLIQQREFATKE